MNEAVEIHDSTLTSIEAENANLVVRLSPAYVHRSEGRPGWDAGSGWLRDVILIVSGAVVESLPSRSPCELCDGTLSVGEASWANVLPLPLSAAGPVLLTLTTSEGESIEIRGAGVEVIPRGEARYVDEFPGAEGT